MSALSQPYQHKNVEAAAQTHWREVDAYRAKADDARFAKGKFYCVSMLPYPSGKLHMGHVRNYTINDVMYRYLRMNGYNVLMPMGWDAFGLPAENAAMKNGVAPAAWTYDNIAYMKGQCQAMGWAIDWSREVATCTPQYYKWNQWLFLKMLEKGIAYKKTGVVNWDPVDQTVLANEQVIDGRGWRSGAVIEKREIPMYYLRITDYAEELLACLDKMDGWPERVKTMQANWIGKSEGVRFAFTHDIREETGQLIGDGRMYVFTTRADTIMGVTFCAVAAEHPLATHAAKTNPKLAAFVDECKRGTVMEADLATMDKKGMPTGLFVVHPLTGEKVEVWVGNYVLMSYGDGAVMAVPAHDERDFEFAKKYGLAIKQVVEVEGETFSTDAWQSWYEDKQRARCVHSGKYDGLPYKDAVNAIAADLKAKGLGEKKVTYRLRDWGISRQRYWGTPIPIVHCAACGDVPVPQEDLPVVLPEDCVPDGSGNPLNKRMDFVNCSCPKCGKPAKRETDTMDTFVDSSWYFMRYCDPTNSEKMVADGTQYWMPMDQYIGGIEHAILHLLYARFWTKVMRDMGLVKFDEPFTRLLTQGMVLNHIFFRKSEKAGIEYFPPDEVKVEHDAESRVVSVKAKRDGAPVEYGGVGTMSKSKLNGVDPQEIVDQYGADTARRYMISASPPEQTLEWSDAGVEGSHRYLRRLWDFCSPRRDAIATATEVAWSSAPDDIKAARREVHMHLKKINYDFERIQYNTVVSGCNEIFNVLQKVGEQAPHAAALLREGVGILLRVQYPITPHVTHALWTELGYAARHGDILDAPWPQVDESALVQDEIELVLQVNGKLRGHIRVAAGAAREAIEAAALATEEFKRHANGASPKKIVIVPGRLVNMVL